MPDEPFALSILPSPPPAERDYDAIHGTVMESARGRWFLDEFARRNRHADTRLVLAAIERLEAVMRGSREREAYHSFRGELLDMARTIARTRAEVAESKPEPPEPRKPIAAEAASAAAGGDVFAAAERIQDVVWTMRERGFDPRTCAQIETLASTILSATSLRDPNDHRTRKLGEVLQYLERRIDSMLETCAQAAEATVAAPVVPDATPEAARDATDGSGNEAMAATRTAAADPVVPNEVADAAEPPELVSASEPAPPEEPANQVSMFAEAISSPASAIAEPEVADGASNAGVEPAVQESGGPSCALQEPSAAPHAETMSDSFAADLDPVTTESATATVATEAISPVIVRERVELEIEPLVVVPVAWARPKPEGPPAQLEHAPLVREPLFARSEETPPAEVAEVAAAPGIAAREPTTLAESGTLTADTASHEISEPEVATPPTTMVEVPVEPAQPTASEPISQPSDQAIASATELDPEQTVVADLDPPVAAFGRGEVPTAEPEHAPVAVERLSGGPPDQAPPADPVAEEAAAVVPVVVALESTAPEPGGAALIVEISETQAVTLLTTAVEAPPEPMEASEGAIEPEPAHAIAADLGPTVAPLEHVQDMPAAEPAAAAPATELMPSAPTELPPEPPVGLSSSLDAAEIEAAPVAEQPQTEPVVAVEGTPLTDAVADEPPPQFTPSPEPSHEELAVAPEEPPPHVPEPLRQSTAPEEPLYETPPMSEPSPPSDSLSEPPPARTEPGPADFLLEPMPPPSTASLPLEPDPVPTANDAAPPAPDALADIEQELFALPSVETVATRATQPTPVAIVSDEPAASAPSPLPVASPASAPSIAQPRTIAKPTPRPLPSDPLAALKAMSDEELIALFT